VEEFPGAARVRVVRLGVVLIGGGRSLGRRDGASGRVGFIRGGGHGRTATPFHDGAPV
jgi:hypothetical protein